VAGFLISNFRLVVNVVCSLLGNSPASEFYMPTFRNTLSSIFIGRNSGVPRNFFFSGGRVQQIQLRTEDRENGDLGAVAP
jgi:hypothetical protein